MPIESHDTGQISIESKSRNTVKCIEFMELFIVTTKRQKDIFIFLIRIFAIFRVEICLFANTINSLDPIGNWRLERSNEPF